MQKPSPPKNPSEDDGFEVMTKIPALYNKPPIDVLPHPHHHTGPKKDYSPINWDLFFDELCYLNDGTSTFRAGHEGALYFCIHGAGHSAMSFALLAHQVKTFGTLVAFDLKGHGYSKKKENHQDLAVDTLCIETIEVLKEVMQKHQQKNVILVGHSLGGSIAVRVADILTNDEHNERIVGCVVIDVVEGTAIEALPFMNQILQDRPKHFDSLESAIKWSLNSGTLRKVQSARVSIPPQLLQVEHQGHKRYEWKVDLKQSQKLWMGWFKGLSGLFLKLKIAKILVTAEKQRLDKELTIAQMQGKFKLSILHNVGHSVQEDNFKDTAKMLHDFMHDFRIPMDLAEVNYKQQIGIANFHPKLNPY